MHSMGLQRVRSRCIIHNMNKGRLGKIISIVVSDDLYENLKKVAKHFGVSQSEVMRRGLETQKEIMLKQQFGYKGETTGKRQAAREGAKEFREGRIAFVRTGPLEDVAKWLHSIDYWEDEDTASMRYAVEEREDGMRITRQIFLNADGTISHKSDLQTIDEVVRTLINEKKI